MNKIEAFIQDTLPLVDVMTRIAEMQGNIDAIANIQVAQANKDKDTLIIYASKLQDWIEIQKDIVRLS